MLNKIVIALLCLLPMCLAAQSGDKNVLLPVKQNGKWGYINLKGEMVVQPVFEYAGDFNKAKYAKVQQNGQVKTINLKGEVQDISIPLTGGLRMADIEFFLDSFILVRQAGKWGMYNFNLEPVFAPEYDSIFYQQKGWWGSNYRPHIFLAKNGKVGLAKTTGEIIFATEYDGFTQDWSMGYYRIRKNDAEGIVTADGKEILPIQYNAIEFYAGTYILAMLNNGKWGLYSREGLPVLKHEWDGIRFLNSEFAVVNKMDSSLLYSIKTNKLLNIDGFIGFGGYIRDYLIIKTHAGRGILNKDCEIVVPPIFRLVFNSDGYWLVCSRDNLWGLYNPKGQPVFEPQFNYIDELDQNVAFVRVDSSWGVVNVFGDTVVPPVYEEIDFFANTIKARNGTDVDIYDLQDDGRLAEVSNFSNVLTIRVNTSRNDLNKRSRSTSRAIAEANKNVKELDSLWFVSVRGWYRDSVTNKWGFRAANGVEVISPQFDRITTTDTSIYAITEIWQQKPVVITVYGIEVKFSWLKGIVNQYTGEIIAHPGYVYIDKEVLNRHDFQYTTALYRDGVFYPITERGILHKAGMRFADEKYNGYTRIFSGEILPLHKDLLVKEESEQYLPLHQHIKRLGGEVADRKYAGGDYYIKFSHGQWTYINPKGSEVNLHFKWADNFSNNRAIVKSLSGAYGLLNEKGNYEIDAAHDYIGYLPNSDKTRLLVSAWRLRQGFINEKGEMITGMNYVKTGTFSENKAWVQLTGNEGKERYIFVDTAGDLASEDTFSMVHDFKEGLAAVGKDNKWGYINHRGKIVIPIHYAKAGDFYEGLAWVRFYNNKYGYINTNGDTVINAHYNKTDDFINGLAAVQKAGKYGFINSIDTMVIPMLYKHVQNFDSKGYCPVALKEKWGIINRKNEVVIDYKYTSIKPLPGLLYLVQKNKRYYLVDPETKTVTKLGKYDKIKIEENGTIKVVKGKKKEMVNYAEIATIGNPRELAGLQTEGIIIGGEGGHKGALNTGGDTIITFDNDRLVAIGEGLYKVRKRGIYSLVDSAGTVLACCFSDISEFSGGVAAAKDNTRKWGIINTNGLWVSSPKFTSIGKFHNGYASASVETINMISNLHGNFITEGSFETLEYIKEANIYRIGQRDKTGYITPDGIWLWRLSR